MLGEKGSSHAASRLRGRIVRTAPQAHGSVGSRRGKGETFARAANSPRCEGLAFFFSAAVVHLARPPDGARQHGGAGASMDQLWLWIGFNAFVVAMLAVDLFVFHKEAHEVRPAEAAAWSASVDRTCGAVRRRGVPVHGARGGPGVLRRLSHREGALGRQHLRVRPHLRLLPRPAALSASRAVLGHPRSPGHARRHDRRRRLPDSAFPLGHLRVRRVPRLHRDHAWPFNRSTASIRSRTPPSG